MVGPLDLPHPIFEDLFHHPFSLSYIPSGSILGRKLSKISLGLDSQEWRSHPLKDNIYLGEKKYYLPDYPNVILEGTRIKCQMIAVRIHRLVHTLEGHDFLQGLSSLHRQVKLTMRVFAKVRHVMVDCLADDGSSIACKVNIPQDWIEKSIASRVWGILKEIRSNHWKIQIQGNDHFVQTIKEALEELTLGPMGRQLLLGLDSRVRHK